jgi:hypothetical protein
MQGYVKWLANSLIFDLGYCLVWFPTTLQDKAYEWYREYLKGHITEWVQIHKNNLNEFRHEVG